LTIRAMRAVLKRLGVPLDRPVRDFIRFRNYWLRNDAAGRAKVLTFRDVSIEEIAHSDFEVPKPS
jgi:hypothetical protein